MATKKKAAKKQATKTNPVSKTKSATPAKVKVKEKPESKNPKVKPAKSVKTPAANKNAAIEKSGEKEIEIKKAEETITIDPALQNESNANAVAPPPTPPTKIESTITQPNSLAVEVEIFGKKVEAIISDHVGRLPMSEKDAVAFIKASNTKCRVEVVDVDVVLDTKLNKTEKQKAITVFLGNEKYQFKPLKLQ